MGGVLLHRTHIHLVLSTASMRGSIVFPSGNTLLRPRQGASSAAEGVSHALVILDVLVAMNVA